MTFDIVHKLKGDRHFLSPLTQPFHLPPSNKPIHTTPVRLLSNSSSPLLYPSHNPCDHLSSRVVINWRIVLNQTTDVARVGINKMTFLEDTHNHLLHFEMVVASWIMCNKKIVQQTPRFYLKLTVHHLNR